MLMQLLSQQSKLTEGQLAYYAETASVRYRVYEIDKRDGGKRLIEHPSRPLKLLQRWINSSLIENLPVHRCATAYRKGAGIKLNVMRHARTNYTVRIDFQSFFPSFKISGIRKYLKHVRDNGTVLSLRDIEFIAKIVTRNSALTIGAPTSPKLTNAMMYEFDASLDLWCREKNLIYTRYADDIFVSAHKRDQLQNVRSKIATLCRKFPYAKLQINDDKTLHLSRKYHRSVTGMVISSTGHLSLGRDRKRMIRSLVFKHLNEKLGVEDYGKTVGLLAFAFDVEKTFYDSLGRKFAIPDILKIIREIEPMIE